MTDHHPTTDHQSKMSPGLKARWLDALRSGRYRQAHKSLKDVDCFCPKVPGPKPVVVFSQTALRQAA